LIWFIPTQIIAVFTAYAIAVGEQILRVFLLGTLALSMFIPLMVSLEAGLTAMMIFEPFRGFLRRAQYIFLPYSQNEPIHLITPIVTIFAFILVMFRHKLQMLILTPLAGSVSILAIICLAQVFNPLQGGLFVGFTGALFILVPMAWFYFGQVADFDLVPKLLRMIVILGLITSLYGVYQTVFGYPYFEQYWIENTDKYSSIAVYNVQRALATFNSAEEWGRYIQIGGIIAVGLGLTKSEGNKRAFWFGSAFVLFVMLIFTGQRTSIFGLMLGLLILFLTGAKTLQSAFLRIILLTIPLVLILTVPNPVSEDAGYELDENDRIGAMVDHTTRGTLDPTGEGSLYARFKTWNKIVTEDLPSNPIGVGLGAKSLAATRQDSKNESRAVDNHFLTIAVSAGVPAMLLLIWILIRAMVFCYRGWHYSEADSKEADLWRIMLALMSTFILNNFFGTSFTIYSIAPIGWLLIGWVSVAYFELQKESEEVDEIIVEKFGYEETF
jgi:hypothetical protein